jgi:iron(III) transport system permease protein
MIRFLGILAIFLAISPLVGLFGLLLSPPVDPFGGPTPTISKMVAQTGVWKLLLNSLLLSTTVALLSTTLGGWLAWVEWRAQYRFKKILIIAGMLVLGTPSYILAATLSKTFSFTDFSTGIGSAIICLTLVCIPYGQLIISAAFTRVSSAEEEAALCLGAGSLQAFNVAIWPQIRTGVAFSFLISFLYTISDFGAVATLDAPVLTWRLYEAVRTQNLAQAAILAMGTLIATIPIFIFAQYIQGPRKKCFIANPKPAKKQQLSSGLLLFTYCLHIALILLGLLVPIYELTSWILDGYSRELPFVSQWDAVWGSVFLSFLGASATIVLVLSPAWLSIHRSSIYKYCAYMASALPGVLLAFGLMVVCLQITKHTGGYNLVLSTGLLLFCGYAMRFLAEAFGPIASSMTQLNPRLIETAKSLKGFPFPWFQKVFLPHVSPSMLTAFLIVFLACIKELPITLLLGGPTGYRTLAFRTWDRYNEALWHDAGLSGLLLLVIALIMTSVTLHGKKYA